MSRVDDLRAELAREEALAGPAKITGHKLAQIEHAISRLNAIADTLGHDRDAPIHSLERYRLETIEKLAERITALEAQIGGNGDLA